MIRGRDGFALLESLVALTLITVVGVNVVILGQGAIRSEQAATTEERSITAADRVLGAASLLHRAELDQRLGSHDVGEFTVDIERPEPTLYRIAVRRSAAPDRTLLVTVVYRKAGSP